MMTLTEDQRLLQDTVRPFMAEEGAIKKQLRHWRDISCKDGFGHGLWKQFGELGLTGVLIPESQGGAGLGAVEAGLVLEEIGRAAGGTHGIFLMFERAGPYSRALGSAIPKSRPRIDGGGGRY